MSVRVLFVCLLIVLIAAVGEAQTWGCGAKDYKCQLDVRMKALKDNPKDPENYYNLGIVLQRTNAHKEAIEAYTMYLAIPGVPAQNRADGFNNRGIAHKALRHFDLAIADYGEAIKLLPNNANFLVNRANAKAGLRKTDEALADYQKAIEVDPKYFSSYAQRAILLANLSRVDEALKDFARSIELNPEYAEPYYNRGTVYSARKQYDKAIADYTKYISLIDDPKYLADAYLNRGIAVGMTVGPAKAVADFTKVIELSPKRPNAYRARAIAYRQLKKDALAQADERKAAELTAKPN